MDNHEHVLLRMTEDIRLRGLSPRTLESYTSYARAFLTFSHRPVAQLGAEEIRRFLSYLIQVKKASPATVNVYSAAIRFLFAVTLNRTLNYLQIPRQKKHKALPEVLTRQEVSPLFENHRILKLEDGAVTFKWRDYKDDNKQKEMTLSANEFIRRFLVHVLPTGFTRIRHYGLLSPRNKATKLTLF